MAVQQAESRADSRERAAVEPFARQVLEFVQRTDPEATYSLAPPIDPGIWIVNLYVHEDLIDNLDLMDALADRATDFLIHDDVALAPLLRRRRTIEAD